MGFPKKISRLFFNRYFGQKVFAYGLLIGIVYILRHLALVLFLTFLFAYLFFSLGSFLHKKFNSWIEKSSFKTNWKTVLYKITGLNIVVAGVYIFFVGIVIFAISDLLPQIVRELRELSVIVTEKNIPGVNNVISSITQRLDDLRNINSEIGGSLTDIFTQQDIDLFLKFLEQLKNVGAIFIKVFLSLVLSFIFIIDREHLGKYLVGMKDSNFGFLYREYKVILEKITNTFGLVFKAQSMIAGTNMLLTTIGVFLIGVFYGTPFPFLYTIAILVFICGFIPVLGTFISSLPILLIGFTTYQTWGVVIEIIILISIVHAVEAYFLNPKIVSSYMKLPMSMIFLVLIIGEYFLGFAGLVIGVSIFYLILDLLKDADRLITKGKLTLSEMEEVEQTTKQDIKSNIRLSRKIEQ